MASGWNQAFKAPSNQTTPGFHDFSVQGLRGALAAETQPREGFSVIPLPETSAEPTGLMSGLIINGNGEQNAPCKCHACGCRPLGRQRGVNKAGLEKQSLHTFKSWSITALKGAIRAEQGNHSHLSGGVIRHSESSAQLWLHISRRFSLPEGRGGTGSVLCKAPCGQPGR